MIFYFPCFFLLLFAILHYTCTGGGYYLQTNDTILQFSSTYGYGGHGEGPVLVANLLEGLAVGRVSAEPERVGRSWGKQLICMTILSAAYLGMCILLCRSFTIKNYFMNSYVLLMLIVNDRICSIAGIYISNPYR